MTPPMQEQSPARQQESQSRRTGCIVAVVIVVVVGIAIAIGSSSSGGQGTGPPLPTASDQQTLANDLAKATARQSICYGWSLTLRDNYSGHSGSSTGSNQGAGRPLDTGSCRQWVTFSGSVTWTSNSSSQPDSGNYRLSGSHGLAGKLPDASRLNNVGVTTNKLVNSPAVTLETVMDALPLLMAESGAARALPGEGGKPAPEGARPPQNGGSDRLREHKSEIILGGIALLAAIGLLVGGVLSVRRKRQQGGGPPPPGSDPPQEPPGPPPWWPPTPPSGPVQEGRGPTQAPSTPAPPYRNGPPPTG